LIDVEKIFVGLAGTRPIFHLEADFQHALAWEIHRQWPSCSMRLEYKPQNLEGRNYIDLWASDEKESVALELKYKTRPVHTSFADERFDLLDHGGQPLYRYDFLKDVERLERLVHEQPALRAYALLLTNDSAYWVSPRKVDNIDDAFRIHQGRVVTGELHWSSTAGVGTTKGRLRAINLEREYRLHWRDYSEFGHISRGQFRYLLVKVGK